MASHHTMSAALLLAAQLSPSLAGVIARAANPSPQLVAQPSYQPIAAGSSGENRAAFSAPAGPTLSASTLQQPTLSTGLPLVPLSASAVTASPDLLPPSGDSLQPVPAESTKLALRAVTSSVVPVPSQVPSSPGHASSLAPRHPLPSPQIGLTGINSLLGGILGNLNSILTPVRITSQTLTTNTLSAPGVTSATPSSAIGSLYTDQVLPLPNTTPTSSLTGPLLTQTAGILPVSSSTGNQIPSTSSSTASGGLISTLLPGQSSAFTPSPVPISASLILATPLLPSSSLSSSPSSSSPSSSSSTLSSSSSSSSTSNTASLASVSLPVLPQSSISSPFPVATQSLVPAQPQTASFNLLPISSSSPGPSSSLNGLTRPISFLPAPTPSPVLLSSSTSFQTPPAVSFSLPPGSALTSSASNGALPLASSTLGMLSPSCQTTAPLACGTASGVSMPVCPSGSCCNKATNQCGTSSSDCGADCDSQHGNCGPTFVRNIPVCTASSNTPSYTSTFSTTSTAPSTTAAISSTASTSCANSAALRAACGPGLEAALGDNYCPAGSCCNGATLTCGTSQTDCVANCNSTFGGCGSELVKEGCTASATPPSSSSLLSSLSSPSSSLFASYTFILPTPITTSAVASSSSTLSLTPSSILLTGVTLSRSPSSPSSSATSISISSLSRGLLTLSASSPPTLTSTQVTSNTISNNTSSLTRTFITVTQISFRPTGSSSLRPITISGGISSISSPGRATSSVIPLTRTASAISSPSPRTSMVISAPSASLKSGISSSRPSSITSAPSTLRTTSTMPTGSTRTTTTIIITAYIDIVETGFTRIVATLTETFLICARCAPHTPAAPITTVKSCPRGCAPRPTLVTLTQPSPRLLPSSLRPRKTVRLSRFEPFISRSSLPAASTVQRSSTTATPPIVQKGLFTSSTSKRKGNNVPIHPVTPAPLPPADAIHQ